MKAFLFATLCFALQNMALAQINVIGLPDTGKSSAVTQFFPNVTGAGTAGAVVHVWYAAHYAGVVYDSSVVVPVTAVDGLAEGGQIPGGGGPLWRLKIAGNTSVHHGCSRVVHRWHPACLKLLALKFRCPAVKPHLTGSVFLG